MVKRLFLVPPNGTCFKCGRFYVAEVTIDGIPFIPCDEENCPYEESRKGIGIHEIFGKKYDVYLRKVKIKR